MKIGDLLQAARLAGARIEAEGRAVEGVRPAAPGGPGPGPGAGPGLEVGSLLKGRVGGFSPDGRVLLELGGRQVAARSAVPLSPGREFWFEVRRGGNEPWLTLADKKGGVQHFLQQASGGLRDLNRLTALLQQLVRPAGAEAEAARGAARPPLAGTTPAVIDCLPPASAAGLADAVARLVLGSTPAPEKIVELQTLLRGGEAGGRAAGEPGGAARAWLGPAPAQAPVLTLPARLQALVAAIRAQLAEAAASGGRMAAAPEAAVREPLAALARIGGMLEALVAMNEQPPTANQAPFWLLPCFFALDAGAGSWLLSLEQDAESSEDEASLAFFLEMSRLGELQLQVRLRGERLEGTFFLADARALNFLRGRLSELRERLDNLGYQAVFRCRLAECPLLPALKAELERVAGSGPRKLIDITA